MRRIGGVMPEDLPIEEPIGTVKRLLAKKGKKNEPKQERLRISPVSPSEVEPGDE
jgi:hypothetical protein